MAVIDINRNPSQGELRIFGLILLVLFGLIGGIVLWHWGRLDVSTIIWAIGVGLTALFYAVRGLRLPMYLVWMRAVYPIGWLVSHLLLGIVYYLVITPIGLLLRLFGRDPLERRINRAVESYWSRHDPAARKERYFHQF
ncbi:MAG: SxtJ family membrane protein [Acidobacteriota bacterium]